MPDPAGYWDEYKEFALGLPYSMEDYEQSDVDVWLMDGNGLNIAMVGHASDPELGERVGEFIVQACNNYHGQNKKIEELHKLLATRGRHCHTCKFCEEVEPCGLGCVHDDGEKACTADDEDPYRNWQCAVDNGSDGNSGDGYCPQHGGSAGPKYAKTAEQCPRCRGEVGNEVRGRRDADHL